MHGEYIHTVDLKYPVIIQANYDIACIYDKITFGQGQVRLHT